MRGVGLESTPSGWCVSGPVNAWKSPCSLAPIVTDNQCEGRRGGLYPVGVMRFWACQRTKKPLELSSHCDRQPEWGVLGWNLPRRGGVYLGLSTLEKPLAWSLALILTDNQSEGRWGGINPARVVCKWAWQRSKSPWSLALIVTDNQSEGCWAGIYPARVVCLWAWKRWKKPLQLSSHPDRQPERGALGQTRPRQGSVSLGLKTLEKAPAA